MLLLWVHSAYSLYKYYATTNIPSVTMLRANDWALATQPTKERVVAVRYGGAQIFFAQIFRL
jgi:hypothetical protein